MRERGSGRVRESSFRRFEGVTGFSKDGLGFGVWVLGLGLRVWGSGLSVYPVGGALFGFQV